MNTQPTEEEAAINLFQKRMNCSHKSVTTKHNATQKRWSAHCNGCDATGIYSHHCLETEKKN